ncbi:hypothetical protein K456DRAFT_647280 [Colletotrichum gloeosporioides 23]|nr:hypothetical protein K456DRAFT_647280 [Colletotrichum gloeosporioides 23]
MLQIAGPVTRVHLIGYAGRHSGTVLCSRAKNLRETHVTLDFSFFPVSSQCPSQVSLSQIWCVTHPHPFQGSGATTRPSSIRQISYNCLMQQRETLTSVPPRFAAICVLHLRLCAVGCLVSSHPSRFRPNATELREPRTTSSTACHQTHDYIRVPSRRRSCIWTNSVHSTGYRYCVHDSRPKLVSTRLSPDYLRRILCKVAAHLARLSGRSISTLRDRPLTILACSDLRRHHLQILPMRT